MLTCSKVLVLDEKYFNIIKECTKKPITCHFYTMDFRDIPSTDRAADSVVIVVVVVIGRSHRRADIVVTNLIQIVGAQSGCHARCNHRHVLYRDTEKRIDAFKRITS